VDVARATPLNARAALQATHALYGCAQLFQRFRKTRTAYLPHGAAYQHAGGLPPAAAYQRDCNTQRRT